MKLILQLQRRRPPRPGPSIALFPFLAVLICTMGALVPLLLAISRTARLQAEAAAQAKAVEQAAQFSSEVKTELEDAKWRIEQLKQSRRQTEAQLADTRLELGHFEEHSRRLRGQIARYEDAVANLDRLEQADGRQTAQAEAELRQVRGQVETAKRQLDEARRAAAGRTRSYAVVPYEGPNQTHRRPVYIECLANAVVLQPEGVKLTESDFEGPLGPGNPLAAALRAAREYMLAGRDFDPQAGEPYPMLLVRPEGIAAYYAARAAMKSWGGDFGYELIGDDWKLAYRPPDPRLAEVLRQVIVTGRESEARLVAAAPRHYGRGRIGRGEGSGDRGSAELSSMEGWDRGLGTSVPSAGGGPGTSLPSDGRGPGTSMPGVGRGLGTSVPSSVGGSSAQRPGTAVPGGMAEAAPAVPGGPYGSSVGSPTAATQGGGTGPSPAGPRLGDAAGGQFGAAPPHPNPLPMGEGTHGNSPLQAPTDGWSGAGTYGGSPPPKGEGDSERPEGYIAGQPPREPDPDPLRRHKSTDEPSERVTRGQALRPGEWEPTPDLPPDRPEKKDQDDHADRKGGKHEKSPLDRHGEDWALRNAGRNSVGITRPIRVECYTDRLVVISDRGAANNRVVPLGRIAESSIDTFVSAIWGQMEAWGMAGRGMYWRPVLQVSVAPDAQQRFVELAALLEGSGLAVERK